jgi:hypothetical protein
MESEKVTSDAPTEEILEPMTGKGLPSYRPWDWIVGYLMGAVIIAIMFTFSASYHVQ